MIFCINTSRKLISSLIGPSVSVGGLYYFLISSSSSSSSINVPTPDDSIISSRGANKSNIPRLLDSTLIRPYQIHSTYCDCAATSQGTNKTSNQNVQDKSIPTVSIRKRMTSIGHFTLKSETPQNLSIPTFFIALAGNKRSDPDRTHSLAERNVKGKDFTVSELESVWATRNMANLHPRFHSKVCPNDDGYFIRHTPHSDLLMGQHDELSPSPTMSTRILHDYAKETLHPQSYRIDLQKRIEYLLTQPLDVSKHLWEVYISNGTLGSSGAISKIKVAAYQSEIKDSQSKENEPWKHKMDDVGIKRAMDVYSNQPRESLLLFRAHHSIADGVSLVAAFGDLVDEADEIHLYIKDEIRKRFKKVKNQRLLAKVGRFLIHCFRFLLGAISALTRHLYLMVITWNRNPFLRALNVTTWDDARALYLLDHDMNDAPLSTRTVSWCEIATVEEVKSLAKTVGSSVTVNDVFVSCVTRAIAHQLAEHRRLVHVRSTSDLGGDSTVSPKQENYYINVVIPVHLFGGIQLPGTGMGNRIGAFVARVPCEVNQEQGKTDYSAMQHLQSVHSSLQAVKNTPAPIISYVMAKAATTCLPSSWVTYLLRQMNANAAAVITNTRGFPKKVHINGRRVEATAGFFPLPPGIPLGVVIQSYDDVVSISVTAERWAVPDADRFLGWILDEYRNVLREIKSIPSHQ